MAEWKILIIVFPSVAALIGWVTNMVAIRLLFKPYEPVRLLLFNLQGVIPKHYREYVEKIADIAVGNFLTTQELTAMLDPGELAENFKPFFDRAFDEALEEARRLADPKYASMLESPGSENIRKQVWEQILASAPQALEELVERADELVDMHAWIVEKNMLLGPQGMEKVVHDISGRELRWIEYFGAIFGVMIGLFQFGFVSFFPAAEGGRVGLVLKLAMPIFGCIVGLVTNWIAVQMLWKPREPRGWWIFKFQGMFPKRQREIQTQLAELSAREYVIPSELYARMADYLTPELIEKELLERRKSSRSGMPPNVKKLLDDMFPGERQEELIGKLVSSIGAFLPELKKTFVEFADRKLDVLDILLEKSEMVDRADFENYLRDIMEKEEIYLVLYGGVLGALMGGVQLGIYILTMAWKYAQDQGLLSLLF